MMSLKDIKQTAGIMIFIIVACFVILSIWWAFLHAL